MNALILAPRHNKGVRPDGNPKRDADEFRARAREFAALHGVPPASLVVTDNGARPRQRAREVIAAIGAARGLDCVVYFGHGLKSGLPSIGIDQRLRNVETFARAIVDAGAAPDLRVLLYSCDAARDLDSDRGDDVKPGPGGEGGLADELRDRLVDLGLVDVAVYAHAVTGHTTRAPFKRVFRGSDRGRGHGDWIVEPGSKLWRAWSRELARPASRLWARFPWMSAAEIHAELAAPLPA